MPDILVRGLGRQTVRRLKARARSGGRSLRQEAKGILERAAASLTMEEARRLSAAWHRRLGGRVFTDSTRLIREDRTAR